MKSCFHLEICILDRLKIENLHHPIQCICFAFFRLDCKGLQICILNGYHFYFFSRFKLVERLPMYPKQHGFRLELFNKISSLDLPWMNIDTKK